MNMPEGLIVGTVDWFAAKTLHTYNFFRKVNELPEETARALTQEVGLYKRTVMIGEQRGNGSQRGGNGAQAQAPPQQQATHPGQQTTQQQTKFCDACGKPMKVREGPHGKFYGCTGYNPDLAGGGCTNKAKYFEVGEQAPPAEPAQQPQPAQVQGDPGPTDEDIPF